MTLWIWIVSWPAICELEPPRYQCSATRPEGACLSHTVRSVICERSNFLSVVSYWKVLLKCMKGNLNVGDPRSWWLDALEQLAATPLILRPEHVAGIYDLPPIHKDPFDRVLIAQAIVEDLELVTTDCEIPRYATEKFRVVV